MVQDLEVIAFDVIETMFSLRSLEQRLRAAGLAAGVLKPLFAGMLRDAFAIDAAGTPRSFPDIARASLEVTMVNYGIEPDATVIADILKGFAELPAHDDVLPALEYVRSAGVRVVTLTNGTAVNTRKLLSAAGLLDFVEKVISVDDAISDA